MAQPRRKISLEEKIASQQVKVDRAKKVYEASKKKLMLLQDKKKSEDTEKLLKAFESSGKSIEDIVASIKK